MNHSTIALAAMKLQVRRGLGAMPSFNDREISGADLEALMSYVDEIRRNAEHPAEHAS